MDSCTTQACFSDPWCHCIIRDSVDQLHASHTEFLTSSDQEYWALEAIFSGDLESNAINQIGAWFTQIDGKWFIKNIFEASPAAHSGLLPGDEVISVDGHDFRPVESFTLQNNSSSKIIVRRRKNSRPLVFEVTIEKESIQKTMLKASIASYNVLEVCGKRIGYFHLWAGTHEKFEEALLAAAQRAAGETDAFILDLRDGFGGAYPDYLNPFFAADAQGRSIPQVYSKPVVTLINEGVRSGKEWIANIMKETHRATLIGSQTRGYFLGGRLFPIKAGRFDLFLAVATGPSGVNLEGNGVRPDLEIKSELPYSAGVDPQLQFAQYVLGGRCNKALLSRPACRCKI